MNPNTHRNPRLRKLYDLDTKIGEELLGANKHRRKKLETLRDQVRDNIREELNRMKESNERK